MNAIALVIGYLMLVSWSVVLVLVVICEALATLREWGVTIVGREGS